MSNRNNLTEIWDVYQNSLEKQDIVSEAAGTGNVGTQGPIQARGSKTSKKKGSRPIQGGTKQFGTKSGPGAVYLNSKDAQKKQHEKGEGTTEPVFELEGMEEPLDPAHMKKKDKEGNLYNVSAYSSQQFDEKIRKSYMEDINNNMKSVFDKLFEEVMGSEDASEMEALGIDVEETDVDTGDSDEVTITLDRDMAEKLCDILKAACGEDDGDVEDAEHHSEDGEYEEYEEAEEDVAEEAYVDADPKPVNTAAAHGLTKVGPGSNKVKSTTTGKANSKKASGKIKDGVDGEGTDLPDSAGHGLTKVAAGSNKVQGQTTTGKVHGSAFA